MAKEKLGINKTAATLFVGCGGIGSDIVARVVGRCRDGETDNLRFVAMDTNANDLKCVRASKGNIVPIQTSSTKSVLDYLKNDDSARKEWFPNNTTLYPKTVSEGAGQVRAISRLALNATIKTGEIQKLYKTIDDLFLKDGGELKQALRVVVVSSACGGTGSGIAMTVGMLIREYLHKHYREKSAIIRGYLLLPGVMDTVISSESERESLRRNGYATIKEISAFMIKASGFCGVKRELERYKDIHIDVPTTTNGVDRLENLPFDFCFLLDRVDNAQESMQTLEQYKEFAAQSLYEQNVGPMQGNAFSMEDNVIKEFANGDNLGRNRFGGIGASILRYPYEDVADYIAYSRAIERIGSGEGAGAGQWLKYDEAYKKERAEFKKKRAVTNDKEPLISDVYISQIDNDGSRFGMDIKGYLSNDIENVADSVYDDVTMFLARFRDEIRNTFVNIPEVLVYGTAVNNLTKKLDYQGDPSVCNNATDNLGKIRAYEAMVKRLAASTAKNRAKAILFNAPSLKQEVKDYHLETLFKTSKGGMHPNAIRYILYTVLREIRKDYEEVYKNNIKSTFDALLMYQPNANNDKFDVKGKVSSDTEKSIDDVCNLEKSDPSIFDKTLGGYKNLWNALNKHLPAYSSAVIDYRDAVLFESAYKVAIEYLEGLCNEFESFYASFSAKVVSLERSKEAIVDKLKFRRGDSVAYVCATERHLERLSNMCPEGTDGLLLPEELNAEIFDAVKQNAESKRLAAYDPYGNNPRMDIFDKVLIGYFRDSVREDCDEIINLDIIHALATEQKFNAYFEANEFKDEDDEEEYIEITDDDKLTYLKDSIKRGQKLASAGVGYASFNEPRNVAVCSFNKTLAEIRDVDVKKVLETLALSPVSTNTVSKYDLRFFNALYNVTPDMLSRFRSPEECKEDEQYSEKPGIYFEAYQEHVRKIGPDSTKSATISLHVDKRWDSLSELPEISMDTHYKKMVEIHSALVYGIVHGMVKTYPSSRYDAQKRIFAIEDTEGELTKLIVSNNTECDEFYEVLDALYRDRATVSKIQEMTKKRSKFDENSNRRYKESAFVTDTESFRIGDGHAAPNSLFEIPLAYYNSLPRAKLDDNELSIMIDSVINVLEVEINKYEQDNDKAAILTERLMLQFRRLIENFKNPEFDKDGAMSKNTTLADNRVVNMTFRKVSNKIKDLDTSNYSDKIASLKALIK